MISLLCGTYLEEAVEVASSPMDKDELAVAVLFDEEAVSLHIRRAWTSK